MRVIASSVWWTDAAQRLLGSFSLLPLRVASRVRAAANCPFPAACYLFPAACSLVRRAPSGAIVRGFARCYFALCDRSRFRFICGRNTAATANDRSETRSHDRAGGSRTRDRQATPGSASATPRPTRCDGTRQRATEQGQAQRADLVKRHVCVTV